MNQPRTRKKANWNSWAIVVDHKILSLDGFVTDCQQIAFSLTSRASLLHTQMALLGFCFIIAIAPSGFPTISNWKHIWCLSFRPLKRRLLSKTIRRLVGTFNCNRAFKRIIFAFDDCGGRNSISLTFGMLPSQGSEVFCLRASSCNKSGKRDCTIS